MAAKTAEYDKTAKLTKNTTYPSPLKKGAIRKTEIYPLLENCPREL